MRRIGIGIAPGVDLEDMKTFGAMTPSEARAFVKKQNEENRAARRREDSERAGRLAAIADMGRQAEEHTRYLARPAAAQRLNTGEIYAARNAPRSRASEQPTTAPAAQRSLDALAREIYGQRAEASSSLIATSARGGTAR